MVKRRNSTKSFGIGMVGIAEEDILMVVVGLNKLILRKIEFIYLIWSGKS